MTINWFSPVPPTRSSIALDTAAVLPALAQRAKIVVWTHEPVRQSNLEEHAQVRHYDPSAMPWEEINSADVTVYHIGNQPDYHGPIWQVSRRHPGIVVLHDLNLHDFFGVLANRAVMTRRDYLQMMEFHHPDGGLELGEAFLSGTRSPDDEIYREYPLTGAAIENALSVIVHTPTGRSQVARLTDAPVAYVPLFAPPATSWSRIENGSRPGRLQDPEAPYQIIIFGFLGKNRRLDSVLQALEQFPERGRFHLDVYGAVAQEKKLLQMIDRLRLKKLITVHGFVSDRELDEALERSDLAVNLRDPTMGEVSASQLRIWQHGLPSLVTDIGWYATLPKNTVARVRRDAELEDIQTHFGEFLKEPERYRELGRNGRDHVNEHHTVNAYVDGLMELINAALASQPRGAARWVSGRAGYMMRPWFTDEAAEVLLPRVAGAISDIFGGRESSR